MFWNTEVEKDTTIKVPKDYADFLGIKEGDKLLISKLGTESLIIKKAKPQEAERRTFLRAMSKGFVP